MLKLTVQDRDELLGRLDERTESIIRELQEQNQHLARINGSLKSHQDELMIVNTTVYGKESDGGLCDDVKEARKLNRRNFYLIILIFLILAGIGILDWKDIIAFVL